MHLDICSAEGALGSDDRPHTRARDNIDGHSLLAEGSDTPMCANPRALRHPAPAPPPARPGIERPARSWRVTKVHVMVALEAPVSGVQPTGGAGWQAIRRRLQEDQVLLALGVPSRQLLQRPQLTSAFRPTNQEQAVGVSDAPLAPRGWTRIGLEHHEVMGLLEIVQPADHARVARVHSERVPQPSR